MKIEITKEEFREILRLLMIGKLYETAKINSENKKMKNEYDKEKDYLNLLIRLVDKAEENNVKLDFLDKVDEITNIDVEKEINILIDHRKRTYTSRYWNILDNLLKEEDFINEEG